MSALRTAISLGICVALLAACNNTVDITYPACRDRDAKRSEIQNLASNLGCDNTAQCAFQWYGYKCGSYQAHYQIYSTKNTTTTAMQAKATEYNALDFECLNLTNGVTSCDALIPPVLSCTNAVCMAQ